MPELKYRKPNEVKQEYALRITKQQWQYHEGTIKYLHKHRKTRQEIMYYLQQTYTFHPTLAQLNAQMRRWELRVYEKAVTSFRDDGNSMALCDLPEEEISTDRPDNIPMEDGETDLKAHPNTRYDHSQREVDQPDCSIETDEKTIMLRQVHYTPPETFATEDVRCDAPAPSRTMFSYDSPRTMSLCGRSSTSRNTRSTFATHTSDSSSLRDFRSTAARAYNALKTTSWRSNDKSSPEGDLVSLPNSWVFLMTDVIMFREVNAKLSSVASLIGRTGCLCKYPLIPPALSALQERELGALMLDLSLLQSQGWFTTPNKEISLQQGPYANKPYRLAFRAPQMEIFAPHPLIVKFDAVFAKEGCLDCLMTKMDEMAAARSPRNFTSDPSNRDEPSEHKHTGTSALQELAGVFSDLCTQIRLFRFYPIRAVVSPLSPNDPTEHLQEMYSRMKELRDQILRSCQLHSDRKGDAAALMDSQHVENRDQEMKEGSMRWLADIVSSFY